MPFAASTVACGVQAGHIQKVLQSRENGPVAIHSEGNSQEVAISPEID
jgi:hypothetical protein